jgi:regulator of protease activity HflC (stomatin/prohibitin superfamily)
MFAFTLLAVLMVAGIIAITVWKVTHSKRLAQMKLNAHAKGWTQDKIDDLDNAEAFPLPSWTRTALGLGAAAFVGIGMFHSIFFYAEPGYKYHVRTVLGEERVIDDVGYAYYLFGRYNSWKKAMTIQSTITSAKSGAEGDVTAEEEEKSGTSASLPQQTVVMLDQVDAKVSATVRFRLPSDKETFLKLVHEYRTPVNLIRAALIPAFQETLQANGSLMGAEEFYSGGRTQFNAEFDNQMQGGVYLVRRKEIIIEDDAAADPAATAASNLGTKQQKFGDNKRVRFAVEKILDADGQPRRKRQKFTDFGINVVEARVTDLLPNVKFLERMQLKQQAAADRAIAREKRVQEEEQKLLAIAKGEREIAEQQAEAKKLQITQTTNADTTKQLALIEASKSFEQAEIDKKTAKVTKERADIDAQRIKVLADADKYEREMRIKGDNALDKKLTAEIEIQKVWADAYARRNVPTNVFGVGGNSTVPTGSDTEVKTFLQIMTLDAAKRLNYDRGIDKEVVAPAKK